ncbi:MAG TPA: alpha-amylase family protein, partial [Armatimonadota bacterium]|nr:alpha-amylase family protein [Armatimonadota bacterium]
MEVALAGLLAAALAWGVAPPSEVACGSMALDFDAVTGQWCGWSENGRELLSPSTRPDVTVAGPELEWPAPGLWQADEPVAIVEQGVYRVSVRRHAGDWTLTTQFEAYPDERRLVRSVTLRWNGAATLRTHQVTLRVPGLSLGDSQSAVGCLPGAYPPHEFPLAIDGPSRAELEPGWTWSETGCAYVRSDAAGLSVLGAYRLEDDRARVSLETGQGGPALVHHFEVVARLAPGSEITVGSQCLQLAEPDLPAIREAGASLSERVNFGPPPDRPQWLDGAVLYEVHPWGRLEAWGAGDRGDRFPSLETQLPYLKSLGVSALWLLPVTEKPPWVYYLPKLREIDPDVGTLAELASMIRAGHGLGIRTLMDIVTYGVAPDSPDVAHLPDTVWCLDENGERQKAWGGTVMAADCSNSDWNAHIV